MTFNYTKLVLFFRLSKQEIREFIAEACEFTNIGNEIESQFFQSCSSTRRRRRALREFKVKLTKTENNADRLLCSVSIKFV